MKLGTENLIKKLIKNVLFTSDSVYQLLEFQEYFEQETLIRNIPIRTFHRLSTEAMDEVLNEN